MIKKIIGYGMIVLFFIALFLFVVAATSSIKTALIIFGVAIFATVWIIVAECFTE